jgi:glycosyltransferase involved in cell wall biosynthesis
MNGARRWRIHYWSPWGTDRSGIATYSGRLVPELARHVDISLIHPDAKDPRYRTRQPHEVTSVNLDFGDVNVFHLGNNLAYHHWMLASLLRQRGVLVMHDWSLFDMAHNLYSRSELFWQRELRFNGETDMDLMPHREDPGFLMDHPMNRRFLKAADVVITHSQWIRDQARIKYPDLDVRYIPHATLLPPAAPIPPDAAITVLGGIGRHKKIPWAIEAFAMVAPEFPTATLRIVGRGDDRWEIDRLNEQATAMGVADRIEWHLDVSPARYLELLHQSLIVVTMRAETAGETSGVMHEAWGAGRVVVTSDQPQFREFDARICRRIPIDDDAPAGVAAVMRDALNRPKDYESVGRFARELMERDTTFAQAAQSYAEVIDEVARRRPHGVLSGLNVYGSWGTPSGIAEVARRLATTLVANDISITAPPGFQLSDYDHLNVPSALVRLPRHPQFAINLLTANINEFHEIPESVLGTDRDRRWNIGLWIYEFPEIAPLIASRVKLVDEIWTGSSFAQSTFRKYFDGPVVRLHNIVRVRPQHHDAAETRERFGLRAGATVVLFTFDFGSGWARKNPVAVVRAFREARLHAKADAQLIIKASGLAPPFKAMLRNELSTTDGVLVDEHLSDEDLGDLFHAADVYCSLHRAEGFGLGMAEAMAIGKTVIGTRYSGNLDFMHEDNSLLVDCAMTALQVRDTSPNPGLERIVAIGTQWADPVHQSAVAALVMSFDPKVRDRLGERARHEMTEHFGEAAAIEIVQRRLSELHEYLPRFQTSWR